MSGCGYGWPLAGFGESPLNGLDLTWLLSGVVTAEQVRDAFPSWRFHRPAGGCCALRCWRILSRAPGVRRSLLSARVTAPGLLGLAVRMAVREWLRNLAGLEHGVA